LTSARVAQQRVRRPPPPPPPPPPLENAPLIFFPPKRFWRAQPFFLGCGAAERRTDRQNRGRND